MKNTQNMNKKPWKSVPNMVLTCIISAFFFLNLQETHNKPATPTPQVVHPHNNIKITVNPPNNTKTSRDKRTNPHNKDMILHHHHQTKTTTTPPLWYTFTKMYTETTSSNNNISNAEPQPLHHLQPCRKINFSWKIKLLSYSVLTRFFIWFDNVIFEYERKKTPLNFSFFSHDIYIKLEQKNKRKSNMVLKLRIHLLSIIASVTRYYSYSCKTNSCKCIKCKASRMHHTKEEKRDRIQIYLSNTFVLHDEKTENKITFNRSILASQER